MFAWRCATVAKLKRKATLLSVAWRSIACAGSYAYATDSYISKVLGIQLNHVQAALTTLEQDGAIIRASVFDNGKPERRIWPSTKIIPPKIGGMDTPEGRTLDTPEGRWRPRVVLAILHQTFKSLHQRRYVRCD